MKKKFCLIFYLLFAFILFAGRKEGPKLYIWNKSYSSFYSLSNLNGKKLDRISNYSYIQNDNFYCSFLYDSIQLGILDVKKSGKIGELYFNSADYEIFSLVYDYLLFFNTNGSLIKRIDDISQELVIEQNGNCSITITETAPIASVPLNYPAIPEDYSTDSYYIKNNTDELVYVVAPDYIGVPHPEAGTLEEGESFFIPSQQITNGLSFYRALFPGESFYLGKAAHPYGQEYTQTAADGFNEYLSLIYLLTPEMNLLYRLENFENYEFTETSDTEGKKVMLELQEEMSVRHTNYWKTARKHF